MKESRNADGGVRTPGLRLIKRFRNLQTEAQHGLEVVVADALMVRLDCR
eukprot:SAG11_NODE_12107_length_721_cov_1.606109_1_plen_48_part_10